MTEMPEIRATRIAEGLGYGEGTISGQEGLPEDLAAIDRLIESPDILVRVDIDSETNLPVEDDGCGDGRKVGALHRGWDQLKKSLNRAKVFGGGLVMTVATRIALGQADGKTYEENFSESTYAANEAGVDYGAHTGPAQAETDSGCGAIDKHPRALENTVRYKDQIRESIATLGIDFDGIDDDFEDIIERNQTMVEANRGTGFSGKRVVDMIRGAGKVVKDLVEGHTERRVVLNMVQGYTVDQAKVREVSEGRAQVFATDVWRLQEIAEKLTAGNPDDKNKAFLAQVVYTLGVAATLTKGDLPVYVIQEAPVPVSA